MRIAGVIPARWGSTRFPGKSLAELCGRPLIRWVFERARMSGALDMLVVATDDVRISRAVESFGGRAVMTRPDHPSGTDRVAEAVAKIEADVVINIQGDEILIEPGVIDSLAAAMKEAAGWDMATVATPVERSEDVANPSVVKVVWDGAGRALYFSRSPIPFDRDGRYNSADHIYWRHVGIYAYTRRFLEAFVASPPSVAEQVEKLEQLRALHLGGRIKVVQARSGGVGVDTPQDVPRAEEVLRRLCGDDAAARGSGTGCRKG